ncbi:nucleotidyltransferase family protein [Calderihabitans maritimus]|uniref:DNA polymerase beta domain-containing protein n=1 Tax=Calderihabitans maritimus TaxID=1246530 RepID=A0A1Z5HX32_9FIRM|nr:nucleotidyltransferase domain-containing protein [Calderihabitans maritimus]GAW94093.1 DNA polymerase beta domain-containing protein [Calderihabitans maritimus]
MVTQEKLELYRAGWQEYKKKKKQDLEKRFQEARQRAHLAADHLKKHYNCNVYLFGSLLSSDKFLEHSDIDMAISGLDERVNFWRLYSEVMDILAPFDFDLIELENIDVEAREEILKEAIEL